MLIKPSGVIAAGAALAVLAVGGSAAAISATSSGFSTPSAPAAAPVPVGSPATATVPGAAGSGSGAAAAPGPGAAGSGPGGSTAAGGQAGSGRPSTGTGSSSAGGPGTPGAGSGRRPGPGGPGSTLATARAALAALAHSPRLLRELSNPISRGQRGGHTTGTTVPGIDVAAFQHPGGVPINWAAVAAAGYKFAAVKATEGNYYVNPWAAADLAAAKKAGLYVTPYHFAIPNAGGGAAQARYVIQHAGYVTGARMLPVMLDIEYDPYVGSDHTNECYGLSRTAMTAWLAAFTQTARNLTGQLPVIYTTADWWDTCTGSTAFGADPMWVAAYGFAKPPLPAGWRAWTFWQYTSGGTVPGVASAGSTDLSVFNTSLVGLINPGSQASRARAKVSLGVAALATARRQPLTFTATGLPPGLAITSLGTIAGAVTGPSVTYRVTVSARNASGAAASVSFTWKVTAAASGPAALPVDGPCGGTGRGGAHPGAQLRVRGPVRPRLHDAQAAA